jgi:hypothetical protein
MLCVIVSAVYPIYIFSVIYNCFSEHNVFKRLESVSCPENEFCFHKNKV